jgi:hypothetical protein
MRKLLFAATSCAALLSASPALAATIIGDTTGEETWNRVIGSGPNLSGAGTDVAFQTTNFTVDANGIYDFATNAITPGFDTYLFLYEGSFDPTDQLTNLLIGNDDSGPGLNSAFSFALDSGTSYFAIVSGFNNADFGQYELTINGVGNVATGAVPEPGAWLMMILGFGAIGASLRRRKQATKLSVSYS